jgi:crossover junction endodeoxyribonuclease RuvC
LQVTGFGIVEFSNNKLLYVASGCVKSGAGDLATRLKAILEGLNQVEKVFVNANPQSTLALGQARGTAICAAVLAGLPVSEYTALQVKQSVVGNGHAAKEQVQHMVKRLLSLPGDPAPDAADALACAICHAHGSRLGIHSGLRMKKGRLV